MLHNIFISTLMSFCLNGGRVGERVPPAGFTDVVHQCPVSSTTISNDYYNCFCTRFLTNPYQGLTESHLSLLTQNNRKILHYYIMSTNTTIIMMNHLNVIICVKYDITRHWQVSAGRPAG